MHSINRYLVRELWFKPIFMLPVSARILHCVYYKPRPRIAFISN